MSTPKREQLTFLDWGLIRQPSAQCSVGGIDTSEYNESDYWGSNGEFLGPDQYGVVPVYQMADGSKFPPNAE